MPDIVRGEIWWADVPTPRGSAPGYRRPVLVVQANQFNRSRIQTVVVAVITSNLRRADSPGNVLLSAADSGLRQDSVVNVSQLLTIDRNGLTESLGLIDPATMRRIAQGLRLVLDL